MALQTLVLLSVASAVLAAPAPAPAPQGLDLDVVGALPEPSTYSIAVGLASQTVADQASVIASVQAEISAAPQTDNAIIGDGNTLQKRTTATTTATCVSGSAQAVGSGPIPTPDTPSAFKSFSALSSVALAAPIPVDFTQVYSNLDASNSAYDYLGFTTLTTYDTQSCAAKCANITGCQAINIYFERDPSVEPGTGVGCLNPPSTNNIKCVFWGAPLDQSTATNTGQWRDNFEVVIAGSNAYNLVPSVPAGYNNQQNLGNAAINAPHDCKGADTYMGVKVFQNVPFDIQLCANACSATSVYDIQQGIPSKANPQTCQFFVTYMLYKNAAPIAQYCAMYNETWNATYATNTGQYDGQDHYTIAHSYAFSNATDPGVCSNAGTCLQPYFGGSSSQRAAASSDCSSFQAATITPCPFTITATSTSLSTAVSTITDTVTVTQTIPTTAVVTTYTTLPTTTIGPNARRTVGPAACPATGTAASTPNYAASCGGPTQYAAACAFYGIMPSTKTLSTSTVTVTSTVVSVSSDIDTATITDTSTLTSTVTQTTTTVTDPAVVICPSPCSQTAYGYYHRVSQSCGVFDTNFNSDTVLDETKTYNASASDCQALQWCYEVANENYPSFRLWYGSFYGEVQWRCDLGNYAYSSSSENLSSNPGDPNIGFVGAEYVFSQNY